ncbi:MAG: galactose-1-phosphate uridylyltransferase, partial [Longimicrobiales bacterium]
MSEAIGLDDVTPHRRQNLLTGEWVLVSPHRSRRPWQG